ncbi:Cofilin [Dactylellina cionopaga]|nr:Cofilin [Dactylellina cionopaga]
MASGIGLNEGCIPTYQNLKLKEDHRYIIYKLTDNLKEILIDKASAKDSTYDDFVADLPPDNCRYAVYNYPFQRENGEKKNKIIFISWTPDSARVRTKMLYNSAKNTLLRGLVGVIVEVQATDNAEIEEAVIFDKCSRQLSS